MAEDLVVNDVTYPEVEAIETINRNGERVAFYPDAVRYNPQTLTDAQKAQARTNIGAVSEEKVSELYDEIDNLEDKKIDTDDVFDTEIVVAPDYTNKIPYSIDTDGTIYNGVGYVSGKTLNGTGALEDNANTCVSGFIPVTKGDVIGIKDPSKASINTTLMFALYKSNMEAASGLGKTIANIQGSSAYGSIVVDGDTATWDTSTVTYYSWNNFAYLRVTTLSPNSVVTVNEEIVEIEKEQYSLKSGIKVKKENLDFSATPLSGKKIVCFGDSLFGMYRGDTSTPAYIANHTGATVHNCGFGGCRMSTHPTTGYAAFSMWALAKAIAENNWTTQDAQASSGSSYFPEHLALLKSVDFNAVDIAVIHYGTNDFGSGQIDIGEDSSADDYTTLCGALRYSIAKLLTAYPKLKIYISLPVYRYWTTDGVNKYSETYTNEKGYKLTEFVEAIRSVAAEFNLPVIDGYYGLGVNKYNASAYLGDGTHHNIDGRKLFGEYIGANLIAQQTTTKSDGYSRKEIAAMLGNYVDDIAALVGGNA